MKDTAQSMTRRGFMARGGALALGAALGAGHAPGAAPDRTALLARLRTPRKHPELVLPPSFEKGAFDALAVDAPFVFRHDGRFWMTFIGFDGTGYRTGLAVSEDLLHWKKEGMIIDRGPKGSVTEYNVALTWILRDNNLFGSGELKKVDGRFLGTYHAYPKPGYEAGPAVIGLCRSDDLRHWSLEEPMLRAPDTGAGDWERGGLYKSCLLEHDGAYYMFYNAKTDGNGWHEQTGVAVSRDLKTWERHGGNPVVANGPAGAVDDIFCSDPCVLRADGVWVMFFYTLSSDGFARDSAAFSDDLLHWEKSNEVLIDVGPAGSIDSRYAHKPAVIFHDGVLHHYYCAVSPSEGKTTGSVKTGEIRGIAVARS